MGVSKCTNVRISMTPYMTSHCKWLEIACWGCPTAPNLMIYKLEHMVSSSWFLNPQHRSKCQPAERQRARGSIFTQWLQFSYDITECSNLPSQQSLHHWEAEFDCSQMQKKKLSCSSHARPVKLQLCLLNMCYPDKWLEAFKEINMLYPASVFVVS